MANRRWSDEQVAGWRTAFHGGAATLTDLCAIPGNPARSYMRRILDGERYPAAGGVVAPLRPKFRKLKVAEERKLLADALRLRAHGVRGVCISALAPTRPGARRTVLMKRVLGRCLRMVERVLEATDRSAGPTSCWEYRGKLKRNRQPVCQDALSKNPRCVRRLVAEFCGCPLPPRVRLRMLAGCSPRCCNPKHCLDYLEATGGKTK